LLLLHPHRCLRYGLNPEKRPVRHSPPLAVFHSETARTVCTNAACRFFGISPGKFPDNNEDLGLSGNEWFFLSFFLPVNILKKYEFQTKK
jgi:hypothetical protein